MIRRLILAGIALSIAVPIAIAQIIGPGGGGGAPINSPTFTGTVTMPDGSTFAAVFTVGGNAILVGPAANTLAQRNGTNAQTFHQYATFTDASNYRRWSFGSQAVAWEAAGTGNDTSTAFLINRIGTLSLGANNNVRWNVDSSTGSFLAQTDNSYDIGASGATRPRNIYAGTGFIAGANAGLSVTKTVRAAGGASDCTLIYTGGILTGGSC